MGLRADVINFNAVVGKPTSHSTAYAVCYIESGTEWRGLRLLVGHDDDAKVYLNGKQIYRHDNGYDFFADRHVVPEITLTAGMNVLVFKTEINPTHGRTSGRVPFGSPMPRAIGSTGSR